MTRSTAFLLLCTAALLLPAACNGSHGPGLNEPDAVVSSYGSGGDGTGPAKDGPDGTAPGGQPGGADGPGEAAGNGREDGAEPEVYEYDDNQRIQQERIAFQLLRLNAKKPSQLLDRYRDRVGAQPSDPVRRFLYGMALLLLQKSGKAEEQFEKAAELGKDFFWSDFGMALVYHQRKEKDKARSFAERILEQGSPSVWRHLLTAEILMNEDAKAGVSYLEKLRKEFPRSAEPLKALARHYTNEGELDRALKILDKAAQRAPADPLVSFLKAHAFHKKAALQAQAKNMRGAKRDLEVALEKFEECLGRAEEGTDFRTVTELIHRQIKAQLEPWYELLRIAQDTGEDERRRAAAAEQVLMLMAQGADVPIDIFGSLLSVPDGNPHVRKRGIQGLGLYHEKEVEQAIDLLCSVLETKIASRLARHDYSTAALALVRIHEKNPKAFANPGAAPRVFHALLSALTLCTEKGWLYKFEDVSKALSEVSGHAVDVGRLDEEKMKEALAAWKAFVEENHPLPEKGGDGEEEKDGEGGASEEGKD